MNIDLKWALPIVAPFFFLGLFRLLWLLAGGGWQGDFAAFISALIGFAIGTILAVWLEVTDIRWTVRIGGSK